MLWSVWLGEEVLDDDAGGRRLDDATRGGLHDWRGGNRAFWLTILDAGFLAGKVGA